MIQQTKNYNQFKKLNINRQLCELSLKKLENSIRSKNMLEFRPIDVNEKMEVIDGQHRLEVAQRLGLPIFYQIKRDYEAKDIVLLNNNQTTWRLSDYLNYYARSGNENYVRLESFILKKNINLRIAFILLDNRHRDKKFLKQFVEGEYVFNREAENASEEKMFIVRNIIEYLEKKIIGNKKFLHTTIFLQALLAIISLENFELESFLKRLEYKYEILGPSLKTKDIYAKLKFIYNWKNKQKLEDEEDALQYASG